ncbi:MAG: glycosyltransferase [Verrucomicrobia bacterium]|nr:glycosyltransferase [Verrucomicrobiota bacterium]
MSPQAQSKPPIGDIILGNSNPRFSGVTSTMLQVLKHQQASVPLSVLGKHHLPEGTPTVRFIDCARHLRRPLPDGRWRVFHARRNNEMLQAVILKYIFRAKIKIIFTATAQRHPSWITRWFISKTDGLITTSNTAAAYLPRKEDIIIPHGIDSERYTPPTHSQTEAWQALKLPGAFGIGIFGRVRPQKGVDLLIDAMIPIMQGHPEFKGTVVVVGETTQKFEPYLNSLQERIHTAGLSERLIFLGKQPFDRIPDLFRGMSLVTALSRNEGFGLTVLEAMSSGTAVLASEAGAWLDIIKGDSFGRTVPIDDLEKTTAALETLLLLPRSELEQMGQAARQELLAHHRIEKEAERLLAFYQEVQNKVI